MKQRQNSSIFIFIFLGFLTAFGPLVTDMYLPTLPEMVEAFHTNSAMVQLGLTTSMVGLAVGQLFFGPLSDKYGRRPLLLAGMVLFLPSTIGCIGSQTVMQFVSWRLIQGIAGASGIVISRSIAADKYTGRDLAKALGIIGAINGVAPIAAPMCGGFMAESIGWQGIFWTLFAAGCLLLAGTINFRESLPRQRRRQMSGHELLANFATVLRNRTYLSYVLLFSCSHIVLFANIASAPFIMQTHYGFSPAMFSVVFGINATAIIISSALTMRFRHLEIVASRGSQCMLALAAAMFVALGMSCSFWVYEAILIGLLLSLGFTFTAANTLAMAAGRNNAGTASAILGSLGFLFGSIVPPIIGIGDIMLSTGIVFLAGAAGVCLCATSALKSLMRRKSAICRD